MVLEKAVCVSFRTHALRVNCVTDWALYAFSLRKGKTQNSNPLRKKKDFVPHTTHGGGVGLTHSFTIQIRMGVLKKNTNKL